MLYLLVSAAVPQLWAVLIAYLYARRDRRTSPEAAPQPSPAERREDPDYMI